jgi:putative lipase involved disintegration of autophagic bodies
MKFSRDSAIRPHNRKIFHRHCDRRRFRCATVGTPKVKLHACSEQCLEENLYSA